MQVVSYATFIDEDDTVRTLIRSVEILPTFAARVQRAVARTGRSTIVRFYTQSNVLAGTCRYDLFPHEVALMQDRLDASVTDAPRIDVPTFDQFRNTGRNVPDLSVVSDDPNVLGMPGRTYMGLLWIATHGAADEGELVLENRFYAGPLVDMERVLYRFYVQSYCTN